MVGELTGQPFLELRAAREDFKGAGELGEANNTPVGDIADVGDTVERQEVVLTHAVEVDVFHQHELLMPLLEADAQHVGRVQPQPREYLGVHRGDAARCLAQSLALGIFAHGADDLAHGLAQRGVIKRGDV